ncbi:MAG: hypothetical protein M0Z69_16545 [Actinomycetota bacterium]|nr:hypothetical protein [Actinomycetota bacterium]
MVVPGVMLAEGHNGHLLSSARVASVKRDFVAPRFHAFERAASTATAVPRMIPKGGMAVLSRQVQGGHRAVLMYLQPAEQPTDAISQAQAEADALVIDNAPGLRVTGAVFATVTLPSEVPPAGVVPNPSAVIDLPAWVVTVSAPAPVLMPVGCKATSTGSGACQYVEASSNYVILDASGAFRGSTFS